MKFPDYVGVQLYDGLLILAQYPTFLGFHFGKFFSRMHCTKPIETYQTSHLSRIIYVSALITNQTREEHKFIIAKNKGGPMFPSSDIIKICKAAVSSKKVQFLKKKLWYER